MNSTTPFRQPLGCLKTTFRHARQQRLSLRRSMATTTTTTSSSSAAQEPTVSATTPAVLSGLKFQAIPASRKGGIRTAFAVYPPAPSASAARTSHPDPLRSYDAEQIARMDPTGARTALFSKDNADSAKVGDVLQVTRRRGAEPFAGVCLAIRRAGIETAVLLRGQLSRVGVEMWFKVYSRAVAGIDIIQRRPRRARRARLHYMRQPKHDAGSVEELVKTWRRTRNVLRTKGGGGGGAAGATKQQQQQHSAGSGKRK